MLAHGSPGRPRPRARGLGAAGALLRAAGALPKSGPAARRQKPPSQPDATCEVQEVPAASQQLAETETKAREMVTKAFATEKSVTKPEEALPANPAQSEVDVSSHETAARSTSPEKLDSKPEEEKEKYTIENIAASNANDEFLEFCLGGPAAVLELEVQQAAEEANAIPEEHCKEERQRGNHMCLSESESIPGSDDDNSDLEDMFDFDPARLADLVNKDAGLDELTEHLQDEYANALEKRIGFEEPTCNEPHEEEQAYTKTGSISQLMTPEFLTPVTTPTGISGKSLSERAADHVDGLEEACSRAQDRKRRSIAIQQRTSVSHRGDDAVKAMESFGRRSLAQAQDATVEEQAVLERAVANAVRRVSKRHRRSVTKASEVLEEAADASNLPLDKWSEDKVDSKVELIQKAMDEAYKRHLRCITEAVQNTVSSGVDLDSSFHEVASKELTVQEKIAKAVSAAYERRGTSSDWCGQWHTGNSQQNLWAEPEQWPEYTYYQQEPWPEQWQGQWHESRGDLFCPQSYWCNESCTPGISGFRNPQRCGGA